MDNEQNNPIKRFAIVLITVIVSSIILFALIPTIGIATEETATADNEGASDLRFNLVANKSFTRTYRASDNLVITGGPEEITAPISDGIVYADDNITILEAGYRFYLIGEGYTSPAPSLGQWFTIKNNNGITITPGFGATVGTLNLVKPTWAYIPAVNGAYAYFDNGAEVTLTEGTQRAIAGLYAGWGAYNDTFDITTNWGEDNGGIYGYWSIDNSGGSVTYEAPGAVSNIAPIVVSSDGLWKYAVNDDGVTIRITDYIGGGGAVVVPSELDGYPVLTVGRGVSGAPLCNVNITSLTISEGVKNIASFAFYPDSAYTFTGTLTLPSSLEYIGAQSFRYADFSGTLTIPEHVGYIGYNAFEGGAYTGLVVKSSATPLNNAFLYTDINEVLNLGSATYSKTSYGLNAGSVATVINADGFIANATYSYTTQRTDITAVLFWLLPLIFLIGLALYFINHVNNRDKKIGGWK